jgi:leader peptidase (prepilin peptidase)/N-methyltransferase
VLQHSRAAPVALGLILVLTLVPVALIDLEHHIIPNRITLLASIAAIAVGTALDPSGEPERLIAAASAGGFLLLAALAYPAGMGMGDVKLAGVMGLLLGRAVAPAMVLALVAGIVVGVILVARADPGSRRRTGVPFGPFLALGGFVALFAGQALIDAYLHHFV